LNYLKNSLADEIETKLKIESFYQNKLDSKNKELSELKENLNLKSIELQEKSDELHNINRVMDGIRSECFQLQDTHLKDHLMITDLSTKLSDAEDHFNKISQEINQ